MNVEIMMLAVLAGITLLAYMVAINAHGPTRLSLSYLIATVMLAGTVWAIVQYVNTGIDSVQMLELKKLEAAKQAAEEQLHSQEEALKENKERMGYATKLSAIITTGTGYATIMTGANLQDDNAELESLMARAGDLRKKTEDLKAEFEKLKTADQFFTEPSTLIKEGLQSLTEATYYYRSYYHSEDPDQEQQRERLMRSKAKTANERFQKASSIVATAN